VKNVPEEVFDGYVHSDVLYNKLMNVFSYGNMDDPSIYLDETNIRMINNLRSMFGRLANKLVQQGRNEEAIAVCDRCLQLTPNNSIPFNYHLLPLAESYLAAGADQKAYELLTQLLLIYSENLDYYFSFPTAKLKLLEQDIRQSLMVINGIASMANEQGDRGLMEKATLVLDRHFTNYEEAGF
jgi:tetratricopeptide (TPR) repeat protein